MPIGGFSDIFYFFMLETGEQGGLENDPLNAWAVRRVSAIAPENISEPPIWALLGGLLLVGRRFRFLN